MALAAISPSSSMMSRTARRRRGDRVPGERGEVLVHLSEAGGDLAPGNQRRHRVPVAHRLAQGDEVRGDLVPGEAPQARSGPAEPGLHLVGQEQSPGLMHGVAQPGHEVRPGVQDAAAGEHRVG